MGSFFRRLSLQASRRVSPTPEVNGTKNTRTDEPSPIPIPRTQTVLLLLQAKQPYQLTEEYAVPVLEGEHDMLVRTHAIGLNPIDWKAP